MSRRFELLGAFEGSAESIRVLGGCDVDECPLERGRRDPVQLGAILGVQAALVGDEAGETSRPSARGRHMDPGAVVGEDAVLRPGRAM